MQAEAEERYGCNAMGGEGKKWMKFTHTGTPGVIFCIERVPRLDGLLVRYILFPGLLLRFTCAAFLRHRRCSQCSCWSLLVGAFFRRGLGHWRTVRLV